MDHSDILDLATDIRHSVTSKILEYGHSDNLSLIDRFLGLLINTVTSPKYDELQKSKILCSITNEYVSKSEKMFKALRYRKISGVPEVSQRQNTLNLRVKFKELFKKLHCLVTQLISLRNSVTTNLIDDDDESSKTKYSINSD